MTTYDDLTIYTKGDWGGRAGARPIPEVGHSHVEVHHGASNNKSAADNPFAVMREYQRYHLDDKGWSDIFYNLVITPDNRLISGRGRGKRSEGTALTVCLMGNYDLIAVPREIMETIKIIAESTPAGVAGLDWHARRAAGTKYASACPGRFAITAIKQLIKTGSNMPVSNPSNPGAIIMPFIDAYAVVRQTYFDAWGKPGDAPGLVYWTELVMKEGYAGWVALMTALHKIGQKA